MAKIAFLGLGQMGAPMATRLLQAGHEVTVWNRTPDRAKPLAAAGATVARSPAEAGAGAACDHDVGNSRGPEGRGVGRARPGESAWPWSDVHRHVDRRSAYRPIDRRPVPVIEATDAVDRDLKVSVAARAWLDTAVEGGAADLDYSAVVATIVGEEPKP